MAEKVRKAKRELWLAQQKMEREREMLERRRERASLKFQNVWRTYKFRCKINTKIQLRKRRWRAAIYIQKHVRARAVQIQFHEIHTRLKAMQKARISRDARVRTPFAAKTLLL